MTVVERAGEVAGKPGLGWVVWLQLSLFRLDLRRYPSLALGDAGRRPIPQGRRGAPRPTSRGPERTPLWHGEGL